jgi:alkylation response protein AidB-like acyl-CoA dehydrogenase
VFVGEAKAYAEDVSVEISSEIFALLGTSATDESLNLDRHWRNARTHSVHDANQWRYHAAGNWFLNGVPPGKPARRLASGEAAPPP